MRYLKYFENVNEYYYSIKFNEFAKNRLLISFTYNEKDKIKSILEGTNYIFVDGLTLTIDSGYPRAELTKIDYIHIKKCDDEWFFVSLSVEDTDEFYKCDQFDGLIKFLEDKT